VKTDAKPRRLRSVPLALLRGLDHDADEALGQVKGDVDYKGHRRTGVLATDTSKLMSEVGFKPPSRPRRVSWSWARLFDPSKPRDYIKSFKIKKAV